MIKNISLFSLALLATCQIQSYIPTPGPLQLSSTTNPSTHTLVSYGAIIDDGLLKNPNALAQVQSLTENNDLKTIKPYQDYMESLEQGKGKIEWIYALERGIMNLVDKELYVLGSYKPYFSMFFTGIRYKWINPLSWLNIRNYISENNEIVDQLLQEFDNLTTISAKYSTSLYTRLKAISISYNNWKKPLKLAAIVGAGLAASQAPATYKKYMDFKKLEQDLATIYNAVNPNKPYPVSAFSNPWQNDLTDLKRNVDQIMLNQMHANWLANQEAQKIAFQQALKK